MEKNDLSTMRVDNDRLTSDLERLKQRLREEITRTQAGVRLDLNLEKGRMRESSTGQELKIKEVDTRIEKEISELRTSIQASKVLPVHCCLSYTLTKYPLSLYRLLHCNILSVSVRTVTNGIADVLQLYLTVTGCSALLMAYLRFRL